MNAAADSSRGRMHETRGFFGSAAEKTTLNESESLLPGKLHQCMREACPLLVGLDDALRRWRGIRVEGRKLNTGPSPPEMIVAQIDRDAVKPGAHISVDPGMVTKTFEEDFLRHILRIVELTEQSAGCAQDRFFVIAHDRFEIRHK